MLCPFTLTRAPSHYFTDVCGVMYVSLAECGGSQTTHRADARSPTTADTTCDHWRRIRARCHKCKFDPDTKCIHHRLFSSGTKKLRAIRRRGLPSSSSLSHPLQVRRTKERHCDSGGRLRYRRRGKGNLSARAREGGREGGRLPLTFSRNDRKEGEGASE